jgi:hypothetical protein
MLAIVIKTALLSVLFIYIIHKIIQFLTESVTVHKTKDLVSIIEKKYDEIHKTLQNAPRIVPENTSHTYPNITEDDIPYTTHFNDLPNTGENTSINGLFVNNDVDLDNMKSELQLFITQPKYN